MALLSSSVFEKVFDGERSSSYPLSEGNDNVAPSIAMDKRNASILPFRMADPGTEFKMPAAW